MIFKNYELLGYIWHHFKGRRRRTCDFTIPQCWGGRLPEAVTGAHSAAPGCVYVGQGAGSPRGAGAGRALPRNPPPGPAAAPARLPFSLR